MLQTKNGLGRAVQRMANAPKKVHRKSLVPALTDQENNVGMEISPSQFVEAPVRCCGAIARQNTYTLKAKNHVDDKPSVIEKKATGLRVRSNNFNTHSDKVSHSGLSREKNHNKPRHSIVLALQHPTPGTGKKAKTVHHGHHASGAHGHHGHHHGHHGENGTLVMLKKHHLHHKFHVANPEPSAILDDDLLFMDVDLDPLMKIRDVQTRVPTGVQDIDFSHTTDPLCVSEYAQEIYHYLQSVENHQILPDDYLRNNPKVTPHMRAILTDWLVQVQVHQQMSQQSLHLSIALIDHVLYKMKISLPLLQLLGITCVLLAAKYVERFPPEIVSLCNLTDNTYEPNQVLDMEKYILRQLNFDLNFCEPTMFLDRFFEVEKEDDKVQHLSKYLLDLSLTSTGFISYVPSKMAASALLMARKILGRKAWTQGLGYYTMYAEKDLTKCANTLCRMLLNTTKYQGAKNKYSSQTAYGAISNHAKVLDQDFIKEICDMETIIM